MSDCSKVRLVFFTFRRGLLEQQVVDDSEGFGFVGRHVVIAVARFADIWHTGNDLEQFVRRNAILVEQSERIGRDDREIERSVSWLNADAADEFADAGATLFTVSVIADGGYDLTELKAALAWRDSRS